MRRISLERARRALGHLTVNERVRGAWHAWVDAWEASKPDPTLLRMMAVARRMHAKLVRKDLYAAFDGWDEHAREKKRLRAVALKVTRRMAARCLAGSFGTWLHWYDAAVAWREGIERRERVLLVMRNRRLAAPFRAWVANADKLKWARATLARVAGRIQRRDLARAFDAWTAAIAEGRTFRSSVSKAHRLIRLIMTRHTRAAVLPVGGAHGHTPGEGKEGASMRPEDAQEARLVRFLPLGGARGRE